jgi:hypothetical protein
MGKKRNSPSQVQRAQKVTVKEDDWLQQDCLHYAMEIMRIQNKLFKFGFSKGLMHSVWVVLNFCK